MATLTLRNVKGQPLTNQEVDDNFNNLNTEVGLKLNSAEYTAADVLTKLKTVDGAGSGLDADLLDGYSQATTNTISTVVRRDGNGDFSAGVITAVNFVGALTGDVIGNLIGTVTGNSTNVNGVVAIGNGGTGASSADSARTALGCGNMATQNKTAVQITGGTITGITDLTVADGGTGASNAVGARTNLGLVIGSDVQPFSNALTTLATVDPANMVSLANQVGGGILVKQLSGASSNSIGTRTLLQGLNISISNADMVSGNATISMSANPSVDSIVKTGASGSGDIGQSGNRFNVLYGRSTSASYADLAENYTTDQDYAPGTVIVVSYDDNGAEATQSFAANQRVLGVVSTNPAYLMNGEAEGQPIALRGRVPTKVVGAIRKGQPLVSTPDGKGTFGDTAYTFAIALETNLDPNVKLVECVIL